MHTASDLGGCRNGVRQAGYTIVVLSGSPKRSVFSERFTLLAE